jgi:hypothetical protein
MCGRDRSELAYSAYFKVGAVNIFLVCPLKWHSLISVIQAEVEKKAKSKSTWESWPFQKAELTHCTTLASTQDTSAMGQKICN